MWLFALMNTDRDGLVRKLGESEAGHFRDQVLMKLREHRGSALSEGLSI